MGESMDKKKILIVDDDPAILDFLTLFLEDVGYEVATASNGNVIRDFPNGMPDLLLLDLWLSGWSGRGISPLSSFRPITRQKKLRMKPGRMTFSPNRLTWMKFKKK